MLSFLSKDQKEKIIMNKRLGTYITQRMLEESFKAYIPPSIPPNPPIDLAKIYPYLEKATCAIASLNTMANTLPNISLFIYMYVRKEALLSSQIEGTQSSLSDLILFEHHLMPNVSPDDVEEVSNYVRALNYGLNRLKDDFPLSLRLLCEIHKILLSGGRGSGKLPGEFRRSQNWIGGTRPGNAFFVPPPVDHLSDCLSDFEKFLHHETMPVLIKAGIAHVQFETIHPFLDGNGRLGRLLITLLLCHNNMLDQPILYLSIYLKKNREIYYHLLQQVRTQGVWETWLEFFLEGVAHTAHQALKTIVEINTLFEEDFAKVKNVGRVRFSCEKALTYLQTLPQVSVPSLAKALNMAFPTARSALNTMVALGILEEISGKKRDKIYVYRKYFEILEYGTEPF